MEMAQASNRQLRDQMKSTLRAVEEYLTVDLSAFRSMSAEWKRNVISALGRIEFAGKEKHISLSLHPLLGEVVRFARSLPAPLEPRGAGSEKQKEPTFRKSILYGRTEEKPIDRSTTEKCKFTRHTGNAIPPALLVAIEKHPFHWRPPDLKPSSSALLDQRFQCESGSLPSLLS
jgi:hypothetical protein